MTDQRGLKVIIWALVERLGGKVTLSDFELRNALDGTLVQTNDPDYMGVMLRTRPEEEDGS